ncbi:MAG: DNA/RNA helicase domain-containing protein, partial [Planctomycetia bacterium]
MTSPTAAPGQPGPRLNAAFYADSVDAFLRASDDEVYAPLASPHGYTLAPEQLSAWRLQLPVLRAALADFAARAVADSAAPAPWIHLEFDIPRLGRRVDAVLVTSTAVIPIEFKVGAKKFQQADYEQAWDYGLDLKNFHAPSHAAPIFPILCATDAPKSDRRWKPPHADGVRPPLCCNWQGLGTAIALAEKEGRERFPLDTTSGSCSVGHGTPNDRKIAPVPLFPSTWGTGSYSPTPTIIEAARSLYARHTVHDITRSDAGAVNLAVTSAAVERIIAGARERRRKAIVFVTGVPGAGKTLVGLNVATRHGSRDDAAHAVFLSGNGPLVAVLREALARDDLDRAKLTDPRARIGTSRTAVRAFIQNVHHFRDATLRDPAAPADHVVVFDEAQRAWDARQLASFMKRKKGLPGFTQTEPELLIGAMERHADWAVVVCLVGGGQEINTGEAGISAWLDGVRTLFPAWDVFISPHLTDSEYAASGALDRLSGSREVKTGSGAICWSAPSDQPRPQAGVSRQMGPDAVFLVHDPALHLSTSMRSFRAERLSRFVKALLDGEAELGRELFAEFRDHYPIVLTRSMRAARRWIRRQRRGTERAGLVASSSARAAQAPRDRHPGEHRPGALVFEPAARHPLIAVSGGRGDGVSGAGA